MDAWHAQGRGWLGFVKDDWCAANFSEQATVPQASAPGTTAPWLHWEWPSQFWPGFDVMLRCWNYSSRIWSSSNEMGRGSCVVAFPLCGCMGDVLESSWCWKVERPGQTNSRGRKFQKVKSLYAERKSLRIDLVKHDPITSRDGAHSNAGFQPFACSKLTPASSQWTKAKKLRAIALCRCFTRRWFQWSCHCKWKLTKCLQPKGVFGVACFISLPVACLLACLRHTHGLESLSIWWNSSSHQMSCLPSSRTWWNITKSEHFVWKTSETYPTLDTSLKCSPTSPNIVRARKNPERTWPNIAATKN